MSKSANAGELRTPVYFFESKRETDEDGVPVTTKENIFGAGVAVFAKWVNAHGTDAFTAMQLELREPATLTVRYSPKIKATQLVYKANDPNPYEIISIDNVEEKGTWLEIKVQRKAAAR